MNSEYSSPMLRLPAPNQPIAADANGMTTREPEVSSLTPDEIRRIVLELIG